jgi:hypothetical protein
VSPNPNPSPKPHLAVVDEGDEHRDGERVEAAVAREGVGRDVEHLACEDGGHAHDDHDVEDRAAHDRAQALVAWLGSEERGDDGDGELGCGGASSHEGGAGDVVGELQRGRDALERLDEEVVAHDRDPEEYVQRGDEVQDQATAQLPPLQLAKVA